MSRTGNKPITIPEKVEVKCETAMVTVKGPKGELKQHIDRDLVVTQEDNQVSVSRPTNQRRHRAQHGLARSLINNMVEGVTEGHKKVLEVHGVGYRAEVKGKDLVLNVGYSHPVEIKAPEGILFEVNKPERGQTLKITVSGIDKALVGQLAADIRKVRKPDPYKGKGLRYEGERVQLRTGKRAGL